MHSRGLMIKLFSEIPYLKSDKIILRPLVPGDLPGLDEMTSDPFVYAFLPPFLYEQKYANKNTMLAVMEEECIRRKESILLAVCPADAPDEFFGLAEIYNYEPQKEKASVGYRLRKEYWGRGYATEITALLTKYLLERTDVRKITAHVMVENAASGKVLAKNGYIPKWRNLTEDWGLGEDVIVDKYSLKLLPEEKAKLVEKVTLADKWRLLKSETF